MDRESYEHYTRRYRLPGEPLPWLMATWGDGSGVHHAWLDAEGVLRHRVDHGESSRGARVIEPDMQALEALDRALTALPDGLAECRPERALFVGFRRDGAWAHRLYDRADMPDEVNAIFDALGLRRPPAHVPKVPRRRTIEVGQRAHMQAMALSPGGLLATGGRDGGLVRELDSEAVCAELDGEGYPVEGVAFAGETIAWCTWNGRLHVGDRSVESEGEPGTIVGGDPTGPRIVQHHATPSLAISADARLLAISYFDASAEVTVFELPGLVRRARLSGHAEPVIALAFSPRTETLATGDWSREVRLWSVAAGEAPDVILERRVLPGGVADLAFSPDGARLAGVSSRGLWIWDIATGERTARSANIETPIGNGCAAAWSPDGRFLADVREGGTVIWDAAAWRECGFFPTRDRPVGAAFASPTSLVVCCEDSIGVWDLTKIAKAQARPRSSDCTARR